MTNVIIFEGRNEVIIVEAGNVNAIVREWFLEGKRSLDDYDVYLTDVRDGFSVVTGGVTFNDGQSNDFDVTELMPHDLREALIAGNQLTE